MRMLGATAVTLAAIFIAAFTIEALFFGRPSDATLFAVRVIGHLEDYHRSRAKMTVDGKRIGAVCTDHSHNRTRTASVHLTNGRTLLEIGNRLVRTENLLRTEFFLAGCPHPLTEWLATQVKQGDVQVVAGRLDGRRLEMLRFPSATLKLEVFVRPSGGVPIALRLRVGSVYDISHVLYGDERPSRTPSDASNPSPGSRSSGGKAEGVSVGETSS
jgi:hypothetical protein